MKFVEFEQWDVPTETEFEPELIKNVWICPSHVQAVTQGAQEGFSRVLVQGNGWTVKGSPESVIAAMGEL